MVLGVWVCGYVGMVGMVGCGGYRIPAPFRRTLRWCLALIRSSVGAGWVSLCCSHKWRAFTPCTASQAGTAYTAGGAPANPTQNCDPIFTTEKSDPEFDTQKTDPEIGTGKTGSGIQRVPKPKVRCRLRTRLQHMITMITDRKLETLRKPTKMVGVLRQLIVLRLQVCNPALKVGDLLGRINTHSSPTLPPSPERKSSDGSDRTRYPQ